MVDEYIRIQRIEALVTAINPGQCCIEPSDDTDLGYRMFCYKDLSSTPLSYKLLAKGKSGLLSSLVLSDLAGSEIGIVRHTTTGLLIGGLMTVDQLNSYLSDGPLIKDCVTSLVKDGELELQGDLVLYEGSNVTITQEVDGFTIASTGGSSGSLDDAYDYGGFGLGRTIFADSGAVRFVVPDAANNAALDLSNSDVTNHPNTLQITRNTIPTSVPSDSFSIFLTGSANQSIFSDQVLYVGAVEESSYSYAYTKYHFDPTNGGALQLYAQGQFSHSAQVDVYASSSLSYVHLMGSNVYLNDTHRNASTWSNTLGIALSASAAEWSAMETLGGSEVSLFALIAAAAASGAGGSLDDAYDHGGAGSGKSVTVDAGAVALTVPTSGSTSALALTNLEASNTSELLNIYHDADASTGYAVYIDGTQGAGTSVGEFGHKIWSPGSITIGHSDDDGLATGRRSFLSLQFSEQPTVPGVPSCQAILEASANESGVLDYSSLYARVICESGDYSSIGSHISLETVGSCSIDAGTYGSFTFGGNLTIDATVLSLNDTTKLTHVLNATYGSGPASASYASGTITADFSDNTPCQEVTVTGNVTALSLTAPSGVIPGCTLKMKASSAYTVGGLTNVEWVDGADLSGAAADSIPAGGWMMISLYYDGTTWHGWYGVHS
jgi:hypothetical protein